MGLYYELSLSLSLSLSLCVCVCVSEEAQLLQEEANGKDEINAETSLNMAEKYQQTELYHDTDQQLQEELKKLKERGGWNQLQPMLGTLYGR